MFLKSDCNDPDLHICLIYEIANFAQAVAAVNALSNLGGSTRPASRQLAKTGTQYNHLSPFFPNSDHNFQKFSTDYHQQKLTFNSLTI